MKRLSSWGLPIILGVVGVALIIIGTLDLDDEPAATLPPIATPSPTPVAATSATPTTDPTATASPSESETPAPTPTPLPDDVTAVQLEVPSVGINVLVRQSTRPEDDGFPPSDAAYILSAGHQPGRNTNSFIFAHAVLDLFKPLWNVQPGAEVLIQMSDGQVLRYVVSEVRPNVPCPDASAVTDNPEDYGIVPPLALQIHNEALAEALAEADSQSERDEIYARFCSAGAFWTQPTPYERLTLQTSQGYNRNWGELVIVADPIRAS